MSHKLKAFPEASRRLLQGNHAVKRVQVGMMIKITVPSLFQGPETSPVQQRTLVARRLPARIHPAGTVNKTHPWVGEEPSPGRRRSQERNVYSDWHTEGSNNLEIFFFLPVSLSVQIVRPPSPHRSDKDVDYKPKHLQGNILLHN